MNGLLLAGAVGVSAVGKFLLTSASQRDGSVRQAAPIASTVVELNETVETVSQNAEAWVALSNGEKLAILKEMQAILDDVQDEAGKLGAQLRGYEGTPCEGHGFIMPLVTTAGYLKGLIESYESLTTHNTPPPVIQRRKVEDTEVVQVCPRPGVWEKVTNPMVVELWGEEGQDMPQIDLPEKGGVCAVLCAGNFEGPTDILHKMFIENKVCVAKNHPVNHSCTDILHAKLLAPLAARGFAGVCTGGIDISSALVHHKKVDCWMMTGGAATFDAIVWGGAKGKASGKKCLDKKFCAELGAASPYIVTPGEWSQTELDYQAQILVAYKTFNSAHICASPQTVVIDSKWKQADQFVAAIRKAVSDFATVPKSYYPGASDRISAVEREYKSSEVFHNTGLVFVPDIGDNDYLVRNEVFANALGIKKLEGGDAEKFLVKAVEFSNNECFGSLSCTVVIDPRVQKSLGDTFDQKILKELKRGCIGVNIWATFGAGNPYAVWGAHPNLHTDHDIQSGAGFMGNCLFVDKVHKSVLRGQWNDPVLLSLFSPSPKTSALTRAFANFQINGRVVDFLCVAKALVTGKY